MVLIGRFLERKGKQVISTKAGRQMVHALPTDLTDPVLTARWEDALSGIADGKIQIAKFEELQQQFIVRMIDLAKKTTVTVGEARKTGGAKGTARKGKPGPSCTTCKKPTVTLQTKKGEPRTTTDFWPALGKSVPKRSQIDR